MAYTFMQLASDWTSLSGIEKEDLFSGTGYQSASLSELQSLGEFRVLCLSDSSAGLVDSVQVSGVHNDFVVLPNQLFGKIFNKIKSMSITEAISDIANAKIRYVLTKDLDNYYTYKNGNWEAISPTAINVIADGMTASNLASITSAQWADFYDGDVDKEGIGIGFAFSETDINQTTAIDNLSLVVDLQGSWNKAEHITDYQYGYPSNDVLHVELNTSGDYKINYDFSGAGGSGDAIILATNEDIDNIFV